MMAMTVRAAAARHGYGAPLTSARGINLSRTTRQLGAAVLFIVLPVLGFNLATALGWPAQAVTALMVVPITAGVLAAMWTRVTAPTLYLFERGAVITRPFRPQVQLLALAELAPFEERRRIIDGSAGGRYLALTLRAPDGTVWFDCIKAEAERLVDVLASAELHRARAVLSAGRAVRYGPVTITPREFAVGPDAVPWTEVAGVGWTLGWLEAPGRPGGLEQRALSFAHRRNTPHHRTIRILIEELATRSRQFG